MQHVTTLHFVVLLLSVIHRNQHGATDAWIAAMTTRPSSRPFSLVHREIGINPWLAAVPAAEGDYDPDSQYSAAPSSSSSLGDGKSVATSSSSKLDHEKQQTTARRRSGTGTARRTRPPPQRRDRNAARRRKTTPTDTRRAPHQFDHTEEEARPFVDALTEVQGQSPNEGAPLYDLDDAIARDEIRCLFLLPQEATASDEGGPSQPAKKAGPVIEHPHFEFYSLDELFPEIDGLSRLFASNIDFREALRNAIREDVFDTTAAYANLSEKARKMLLLPDSSLQGSWRCNRGQGGGESYDDDGEETEISQNQKPRMAKLTRVFDEYLEDLKREGQPLTGDDFMERLGSLCGSEPSTHWMDMVGVADRRIPHSWHQVRIRMKRNRLCHYSTDQDVGGCRKRGFVSSAIPNHMFLTFVVMCSPIKGYRAVTERRFEDGLTGISPGCRLQRHRSVQSRCQAG